MGRGGCGKVSSRPEALPRVAVSPLGVDWGGGVETAAIFLVGIFLVGSGPLPIGLLEAFYTRGVGLQPATPTVGGGVRMAELVKAPVLKTEVSFLKDRGFKSHSALGVGRAAGGRVRSKAAQC